MLRGIAVTTYGIPFYAGWGLTRDRRPSIARDASEALMNWSRRPWFLYPTYICPVGGQVHDAGTSSGCD
ncbi:capsular polysaccharide export protein, LipB/KpsS family [Cupriavidus basilensis]